MSTGNIPLSLLDKNGLTNMVEATKIDLLKNEKKTENILKGTYCDRLQLEKHINTCFKLRCKLEDCLERLKKLELKDDYTRSSCTLMDFVSSISNVINDSGPEALIVVTSEIVRERYTRLIRYNVKDIGYDGSWVHIVKVIWPVLTYKGIEELAWLIRLFK